MMRFILKKIIAAAFLFVIHWSVAQDAKKDSLLNILKNDGISDSARVSALINLSVELEKDEPAKAHQYTDEALALARETGYTRGVALALNEKGEIYKAEDEYQKAVEYFTMALQNPYAQQPEKSQFRSIIYNRLGLMYFYLGDFEKAVDRYTSAMDEEISQNDTAGIANIYANLSLVYENQGNYAQALKTLMAGLELMESINNMQGVADAYNSIAIIYKRQGEIDLALQYHQMAIEISKKENYLMGTVAPLVNMGVIYKDRKQYDQALSAYREAAELLKGENDPYASSIILHNTGKVYAAKGDHEEALNYLMQSLDITREVNLQKITANNLLEIANAQRELGRLNQALESATESLDIAIDIYSKEEIKNAHLALAKIYEKQRVFEKAFSHYTSYSAFKDSLMNESSNEQINQLKIQYEAEKKDQEIQILNQTKELQTAEIQQQRWFRNIFMMALALFSVLGFVLFRNYKLVQSRKRLQLNMELEKEQMEAQRLHELDAAKSRFFANIAHEFRTPLTLISIPSDQIIEETGDPRLKENALLIRRNAEKLLQLVNQLLDLSRMESGMIRLKPECRDIVSFTKGCVFAFESLAEEKDIELEFHSPVESLEMDFDPDKYSMIVNNLLSNALKFTPPFGKTTVAMNVDQPNKTLTITVEDTGVGIPADKLGLIFNRFYQVDDNPNRAEHGAGIGLALTKELVELHNGKIVVESEPGAGSKFIVAIPVEQNAPKTSGVVDQTNGGPVDLKWMKETAERSESQAKVKELTTFDYSVLVVDDNKDIRNFISDAIGAFYKVFEAENGKRGLEIARDQVPDLIISDVMMPEMDGFEFCENIKRDDATSHIPVILLTAKAGLDSKIEGLETGADDYLAKPFNIRELLVRMKNLISQRRRLQQKFNARDAATEMLPKKENAFIVRLKAVIDEHIGTEELNMDDLGRAIGMSRTQVHRKLKALTDQSTSQFIRNYRLEKALELLKGAEVNVAEAAYQVGFSSPAYFSTCFTEKFGFAPSEIKMRRQ